MTFIFFIQLYIIFDFAIFQQLFQGRPRVLILKSVEPLGIY